MPREDGCDGEQRGEDFFEFAGRLFGHIDVYLVGCLSGCVPPDCAALDESYYSVVPSGRGFEAVKIEKILVL